VAAAEDSVYTAGLARSGILAMVLMMFCPKKYLVSSVLPIPQK